MFSETLTIKINNIYNDTTVKNLKTSIRKLYKYLNINSVTYDKMHIINNVDTILDFINSLNVNVAKLYLNYYVKLLSFEDITLNKLSQHLKKVIELSNEKRKENKEEKLIDIDINDVYKYFYDILHNAYEYEDKRNNKVIKRSKPAKFSLTRCYRTVLFSILSDTPVRLTELSHMKFMDDGTSNFIDIENKRMFIRNQKVKQKPRIIKLKDNTINDIKYLIAQVNPPYLFMKKRCAEECSMDGDNIEQVLRCAMNEYKKAKSISHIPHKFGIHSIRHNKVSKQYNEINLKIAEIKEILSLSQNMGHSISTQIRDYFKCV